MTKGLLSGEFMTRAFNAATDNDDKANFLDAISDALNGGADIVEESFDLVKTAMDDKHGFVRKSAHEAMADIIRHKPEVADASLVAKVTEAAIYDNDSLIAAGNSLKAILAIRPELSSNAFMVAKDAIDIDKNNRAHYILNTIISHRPDLADNVFSLIKPEKQIRTITAVLKSFSPK